MKCCSCVVNSVTRKPGGKDICVCLSPVGVVWKGIVKFFTTKCEVSRVKMRTWCFSSVRVQQTWMDFSSADFMRNRLGCFRESKTSSIQCLSTSLGIVWRTELGRVLTNFFSTQTPIVRHKHRAPNKKRFLRMHRNHKPSLKYPHGALISRWSVPILRRVRQTVHTALNVGI